MKRQAKALLVLAATCALIVLGAGAALADYTFEGTFAGPGAGSGDGELTTPGRAAVEQSTGNLFVVDSGNDRVQVFESQEGGTATYLTQFGSGQLNDPWGIAIDEDAGQTYVYVADAGNDRIVKYASDEAAVPSFSVDASFTSPAKGAGAGEVGDFHAALAIDPTNGDLIVADNSKALIQRFESDGTFLSSFDGSNGAAAFEGPIDVAANSSGDIYVVDANGNIAEADGTSKALRYSSSGQYKATLGPAGTHERPATVAVNPFNDEVVLSGDQDAVYEAGPPPFVPVLQRFDSSNQALPSPTVDIAALYDTVAGLAIATGSADTLYVVFDVGHFAGSPYGQPQIQAFAQVHPTAPEILHQGAAATPGEATLTATIDTGSATTDYRFEWGETASYGNQTPSSTLPGSVGSSFVKAQLPGLAASTTYHFRVVAENSIAEDIGPDQTFTTPAADSGPENCANRELRERQGATGLGECRAFEMASPVEKNGNEVTGFYTVQASPDGSRVAYASTGAFPGSESSPAQATYLSNRGGGDWSTRTLSPAQINPGEVLGAAARDFSADLARGVSFSKLALAPGAVAGNGNIYLQNNLTGVLEYVGGSSDPFFFSAASNTGGSVVYGGSDDYSHVVLATSSKLTDDAPEGSQSVYEISDGALHLVSILPNGEPVAEGAFLGKDSRSPAEARAVSADGERIFFGTSTRLYERIEGDQTIELSASEVPGAEGAPLAGFGAASDDGSVVFFTANARLTLAGEPDPAEGYPPPRLYRHAEGQLEQIAIGDANFAARISVLSVTPDGETAYFLSENEGGESAEARQPRIYRWALGEGLSELFALEDLGRFDREPARWTMSPSGRFAAFQVLSRLTPDAQPGPECKVGNSSGQTLEGHCYEIYVYDAVAESIDCASCSPFGFAPIGHSTIGALFEAGALPPVTLSRHLARGIADDGTVYFDSPSRLTPSDADSKRDVYQWRVGDASLLTPGTPTDVAYADASSDGSTVFALVADRLVSQDRDSNYDVYAIRREGGIAAQNPAPAPPPCVDEACQGPPSSPPVASPPASTGLQGPGNAGKGAAGLRVASRVVIQGPRGPVRVGLPGAGTLTIKGAGLRSRERRFGRQAQVRVQVALTETASRNLHRKQRIEVVATMTYRSAEGGSRSKRVALTFVVGKGR